MIFFDCLIDRREWQFGKKRKKVLRTLAVKCYTPLFKLVITSGVFQLDCLLYEKTNEKKKNKQINYFIPQGNVSW